MQLESCLHQCNKSQESDILLVGIKSWQDTCAHLEEVRAQFPCWKENGHELSQSCRAQTLGLKESMYQFARNQSESNIQNICSDYDKFSTCFTQAHRKLCGYRSEIITGRMFHVNREAMFNMLKIRWSTLPSQCGYSQLRRDTYSSEKLSFLNDSTINRKTIFVVILLFIEYFCL
ncbi:hypothetical protein DICVIV_08312 [Dictyocaulus viviparus]|uniref:Chondroitin proteoglycan 4 domain-containing protein n=1 Tax=Dictyocaulus viviparus TaxID=29172 RepID=A0A0D8XPA2_DICVI|nr:hypothetical protein DICVIV_08312 [Dictyocaulus viviparus]